MYNNEWKKGLGYTNVEEKVKKNEKEKMFQHVRPLSAPVKFVNYEPPLKCEVKKAESEESKKSVLNSEKSKIPIVKNAIKIYRVKEKNI